MFPELFLIFGGASLCAACAYRLSRLRPNSTSTKQA